KGIVASEVEREHPGGLILDPDRKAQDVTVFSNMDSGWFTVRSGYPSLRSLGLGLDQDSVNAVRTAGLTPVARISNWIGVSPISESNVLSGLKKQGIETVIFNG